ncbi:DoxX family protein [Jatrophihabitans sp. YIM 134969]
MNLLRTAGRAALGWVFVFAGSDVVLHPEKPTNTAGWLFDAARSAAPLPVPPDVHLVRANAAVQVAAGTALATGFHARPAALVLMGSLLPTTVGGHAFWRHEDPVQRKLQRLQFTKNIGLFGGLLLTVADRSETLSRRLRRGASS